MRLVLVRLAQRNDSRSHQGESPPVPWDARIIAQEKPDLNPANDQIADSSTSEDHISHILDER